MRLYLFIIFTLLFGITFFVYKDFFQTFYQQDEWHSLGSMKTSGIHFLVDKLSVFDIITFGNRPLAWILGTVLLSWFPFNIGPYVIFSLFIHATNAFLIYLLLKNLKLSEISALIGSLFFLLNATGKQAVLWISAGIATLPSTTGILIGFLFYLSYLKTNKNKFFLGFILSIIFSLGFKESALFILILIPLLDISYNFGKKRKFLVSKSSMILLLFSVLVFVSKFLSVFLFASSSTRYVNASSGSGLARLIWNSITYPIESFSQIIVPDGVIFPLSKKIMENIFPYFETTGYAGVVSEKIMVEFVSILIAFFLLPFMFILFQRKEKFPVILGTLFFLLSFIPYIVLIKANGYLESRYYYLSVVAVSILVSLLTNDIVTFQKKKVSVRAIRYALYIVPIGFFIWYIFIHVSFIQKQISFQIERAVLQRPILEKIVKEKPELSKKQIIYIESDHEFITDGNPLPFQAGIGHILLVYYAYKNDDSGLNPFIDDNYFWQLGNQGYKVYGDRGFGFFANKELLEKELVRQNLSVENVVAFRYKSESNTLSNITDSVRTTLQAN